MAFYTKGTRKEKPKKILDLAWKEIKEEIDHRPLDPWQKEVLDFEGDIAICSGRQVGKSAIMALKAAKTLLKYSGIKILITSASERQAAYIYDKVKLVLREVNTSKDSIFADTPTMRQTKLKNGSELYCLPTGITGDLIRGLTLDIWIPDEAAYVNDMIWATISPMLWISKQQGRGWIWALSTPAGREGRFFECFTNPAFKQWHISALDCPRIPADELERWRKTYSRLQYEQEVLGNFVEEISRFFSDALINKCVNNKLIHDAMPDKFLGIDVARYGGDENAFVQAHRSGINRDVFKVTGIMTTKREGIHETFAKIMQMEEENQFAKILIDDAGVGGGLTDFLIEKLKSKVLGLNNAQRVVNRISGKDKKKKLMKEDLYSNAAMLMEQGAVEIEKNEKLIESLQSILYEYADNGDLRIFGRYTHLAEAFVRALYGAKSKSLNLWVRY